jgi:tetratricopeptide (TPR) repeat protein
MGDRRAATDFYNQAVVANNDKANPQHLQHSYQLFCSACYADPTHGQSFYQSGNNTSDLNLLHAAVACYRRALECENKPGELARIWSNLGWRLHGLGRTDEAMGAIQKAIEIDPRLEYAWLTLSQLHCQHGQSVAAVGAARKAFELKGADPVVEIGYAFTLLFDEQYALGLKHFESRFPYKLKNFLQYPYPKWLGEEDKTVFLVADQGLGDTLSFARFVPAAAARAKYIHAMVQPELMRLFGHAFRNLPNVNLLPTPVQFPAADAWSTFVSLPFALGLTDHGIRQTPNIDLPLYGAPLNWKVSDRRLHIGIAWAGSPLNDIDRHRTIPITHFLELYRVPGVQLYGLQVGERVKDLHESGAAPLVRDLSGYIRDVVDTMSIIRELDLVITCESALGHIAGAMGRNCWVPYSWMGRDWRIGCREGRAVLWNPNHQIFWQDQSMSWDKPFGEMERALRRKLRQMNKAEAAA